MPQRTARLRSPLVGRQAELNTLFAALGRLSQGQGGIVSIIGEAGLGKSRLVAEARNTQQIIGLGPHSLQPLTWLEGRCLSYASATAYHLWIDLLRSALKAPPDAPPAVAAQALQRWIKELCPANATKSTRTWRACWRSRCRRTLRPPGNPRPAATQARDTFQAVETVVVCLAKRSPLAACLRGSALVRFQLARVARAPAAARGTDPRALHLCLSPDPEHGSWQPARNHAQRYKQWHDEIVLQPLSPTETEALILNLLGAWLPTLPHRRS